MNLHFFLNRNLQIEVLVLKVMFKTFFKNVYSMILGCIYSYDFMIKNDMANYVFIC